MKKYAQALVAAITIATLVVALAYLTVFIIIASEKDAEKDPVDYLILVNKEHKLPNNWEENIELTTEKDIARS